MDGKRQMDWCEVSPSVQDVILSLRGLMLRNSGVLVKDRRRLPDESGVYLVHAKHQPLYVGAAENLRRRWTSHHRFRESIAVGARIAFLTMHSDHAFESEPAAIEFLSPAWNGRLVPLPKSFNGKRRSKFQRAIMEQNDLGFEDIRRWYAAGRKGAMQ